jgi:hypothetical protein
LSVIRAPNPCSIAEVTVAGMTERGEGFKDGVNLLIEVIEAVDEI